MGENQSAREPLRPVPTDDGFGLGWDSVRNAAFAPFGLAAWRKNGGTSTYATDMIILPQAGLGAIAIGSSVRFKAGRLIEQALIGALVEQGVIPAMPQPLTSFAKPVAAAASLDPRWFDGIFAHYAGLSRFEKNEAGEISMAKCRDGKWNIEQKGLRQREDGALVSDDAPNLAFSLVEAQGSTYLAIKLVSGLKHYDVVLPGMQKLPSGRDLSPAWARRIGKTWALVNEPFDSVLFEAQQPVVQLNEAPGQKGYVVMSFGPRDERVDQPVDAGKDDKRGLMCLKIPFNSSRDLNDLEVIERGSEEWLRIGSSVFRPLEGLATLGAGAHALAIGPEGYAEWRRLGVFSPLSISGCSHWKLFNDEYEQLAAGAGDARNVGSQRAAFLWVVGKPGATIKIALA
jgi:hypothetical protein